MSTTESSRIPRIIHYCWFGENPLPKSVIKYINTWRRIAPDFRIIEWNETNFDLSLFAYAREAYDATKFAFVTDIVRLYALKRFGGIYLDTDVELIKPLERFLHHPAFSGFEDTTHIPTAIMGSEPEGVWVRRLLDEYNDLHFTNGNDCYDLTTNVVRITQISELEFGVRLDNTFQESSELALYPNDYFCPKSYDTGIITRTRNTHAVHHFSGTWLPAEVRSRTQSDWKINRVLGASAGRRVIRARNFARVSGYTAAARYIAGGVRRRLIGR